MILQWPRTPNGAPARELKARASGEDAFEAGLRRSLGSVHFVAYEPHAGGFPKRALDLALTLITFPIWGSAIFIFAQWAKRKYKTDVMFAEERVGYGGAAFNVRRMRLAPPMAEIVTLHPDTNAANDEAPATPSNWDKWRPVVERLPTLFNVMAGEMSLVGPRPRDKDQLDGLGSGKRYYLSARPGLLALTPEHVSDEEEALQCKFYVKSWMIDADVEIVVKALKEFRG